MARHESAREDLWEEIRGLEPRLELHGPAFPEPVVAGLRPFPAGWSLFFGQDAVWHFDALGRLRRAYVDGRLYRSQGDTLAELERRRSDHETQLLRRDLAPSQLNEFLQHMRERVARLREGLQEGTVLVGRSQAATESTLADLLEGLARALSAEPWLAPGINARR